MLREFCGRGKCFPTRERSWLFSGEPFPSGNEEWEVDPSRVLWRTFSIGKWRVSECIHHFREDWLLWRTFSIVCSAGATAPRPSHGHGPGHGLGHRRGHGHGLTPGHNEPGIQHQKVNLILTWLLQKVQDHSGFGLASTTWFVPHRHHKDDHKELEVGQEQAWATRTPLPQGSWHQPEVQDHNWWQPRRNWVKLTYYQINHSNKAKQKRQPLCMIKPFWIFLFTSKHSINTIQIKQQITLTLSSLTEGICKPDIPLTTPVRFRIRVTDGKRNFWGRATDEYSSNTGSLFCFKLLFLFPGLHMSQGSSTSVGSDRSGSSSSILTRSTWPSPSLYFRLTVGRAFITTTTSGLELLTWIRLKGHWEEEPFLLTWRRPIPVANELDWHHLQCLVTWPLLTTFYQEKSDPKTNL